MRVNAKAEGSYELWAVWLIDGSLYGNYVNYDAFPKKPIGFLGKGGCVVYPLPWASPRAEICRPFRPQLHFALNF